LRSPGRPRGVDGAARRRRQASRNELRKLALYSHGQGEVTLDDVMNRGLRRAELKLDPIVDGAFAASLIWSKANSQRR